MLSSWLIVSERSPSPYGAFNVIDYSGQPLTDEIKQYLESLLRESRLDPAFIEAAKRKLSWPVLQAIQHSRIPSLQPVQRGDFGEVVSAAILTGLHDYRVPVKKFRYVITGNQTLPSTDVLALKLDSDGKITEVCFVESKLRTTGVKTTAVTAYNQLKNDQNKYVPDMLLYAAERLIEKADPLGDKCLEYLESRLEKNLDASNINLFYDSAHWDEEILDKLDGEEPDLQNLSARIVLIPNLRQITDELFGRLGITQILEEED